jgi:hypothetical protein
VLEASYPLFTLLKTTYESIGKAEEAEDAEEAEEAEDAGDEEFGGYAGDPENYLSALRAAVRRTNDEVASAREAMLVAMRRDVGGR